MNDWLIRFGLTRDSKLWLWSRITAVLALVASGAIDITGIGSELGLTISPVAARWVALVSTAVLWLSGKYDTSPLPGKDEAPK
jgi:hypothetical protein